MNRRPTTADAGTPGQPYPPPSWVLAASVGAALLDKLLATSDSSTSRRPLSTYATDGVREPCKDPVPPEYTSLEHDGTLAAACDPALDVPAAASRLQN